MFDRFVGKPEEQRDARAQSAPLNDRGPEAAARIAAIERRVVGCRLCPRLVEHREEIARVRRRAFREESYWGRPLPAFGDPEARLVMVGLAPAAHGGNRTGRMFTGDRSGDQLYAALHRAGLVNQPTSVDAADGLRAKGVRIAAPVRCAPPANAPTPAERDTCWPWLEAEWRLVSEHVRVIVALGGFAWQIALRLPGLSGMRKPRFGHGVVAEMESGARLLGCYHPSQQNMFTGRLTPVMLDDIFASAKNLAGVT